MSDCRNCVSYNVECQVDGEDLGKPCGSFEPLPEPAVDNGQAPIPFVEWAKQKGIDMTPDLPDGHYSAEFFSSRGLPMVVACSNCEMTMVVFSAYVQPGTSTVFCGGCSGHGN